MDPVVRAIDVGYANTKYVTAVDGTAIRCAHFASVAPYCRYGESEDGLGGKRKTVVVPVGEMRYEVGPEVHLAADIYQARQTHDGYCETAEYLAVLRGAMSLMRVDRIDLLMLGLPVSTFRVKRTVLERRMRGTHELAQGKSIAVHRVKVLAQPQGALIHYGVANSRLAELNNEVNLVIDAGGRTYDWLVARGMRVLAKRSDSANRGMFDALDIIADAISKEEGTNFRDYSRIDLALRTGAKPKVFGREHDIAKHVRMARTIAEAAVGEMRRCVGDGNDIDNIVLVGGAAFFYKPTIAAAFPKHKIQEIGDGLYANVKGFQLAGMELARTPGSAPVAAEETGT